MKYLHTAAILRPPSGIINQMRWESEASAELGIDWHVKLYCPKGWMDAESFVVESRNVKAEGSGKSSLIDWIKLRYEYHAWLMRQEGDYDAFILRYSVHDPFQAFFVRFCKKPVYFVHHTLEVPELRMASTVSARLRGFSEKISAGLTLNAAAGIIGVTKEIVNYEVSRIKNKNKKQFVYPNGIKFNDKPVIDKRGGVPEFIFIAGYFSPWHGLDMLLDSIEKSEKEFKLHLIGEVFEPDLARALKDPRIRVYGCLSSEEIRSIASTCWLGLSSFGLHRKKMNEACTLKVREYLMMGLPVYAGHKDIAMDTNKFIFTGNADIDSILNVAYEKYYSREEVFQLSKLTVCKKKLLNDLFLAFSRD